MGLETATILSFVGPIFSKIAGSLLTPKPKSASGAAADTEDARRKAARQRTKLVATAGGQQGQELQEGGVSRRPTLLGN